MAERHPKKEIEDVISELEEAGWRIERTRGYAWARAMCPESPGGCMVWIKSTPSNLGGEVRKLRRALKNCSHPAREN